MKDARVSGQFIMSLFTLLVALSFCKTFCKAYESHTHHDHIPHEEIAISDVTIKLRQSTIESLGDGEFSRCSNLHTLKLTNCHIKTVSATAFSGTRIKVLRLKKNELTEFPDLQVISNTMTELHLSLNKIEIINQTRLSALRNIKVLNIPYNPLKILPDFTEVGILQSSRDAPALWINNITLLTPITTFCGFRMLNFNQNPLKEVPFLACNNSQLWKVRLDDKGYTVDTDFSNLTSFVNLRYLSLNENAFSENFPDLPNPVREKLNVLLASRSHMTYISADRLANYSLKLLNISENELVSVPVETFHISFQLDISFNPWNNFTTAYWRDALYHRNSKELRLLDMSGSMPQLAYIHGLKDILCTREGEFDLYLRHINVPCDCTVLWILQIPLLYGINIYLDHRPCHSQWDNVTLILLNCPQRFIVISKPNGEIQMIEDDSTFVNIPVEFVYTHDIQCEVRASSGDILTLGPGVHIYSHGINSYSASHDN